MKSTTQSAINKAHAFLAVADQFRLGELSTEQPHSATANLSYLANNDLPKALAVLKKIDDDALTVLAKRTDALEPLACAIRTTLANGRNIFLCGCGATGRLSLTLETLWRERYAGTPHEDRVVAFMAGGDVALVRSIEKFEDFPTYGHQQLVDAGFGCGDLLISCTEGGETPFVIGATEAATNISTVKPFFLYCNPDEILCRVAQRSNKVIENPAIEKINLDIGPMALAGSTRMQASTVLMAAVGMCLFGCTESLSNRTTQIHDFVDFWRALDTTFLDEFIQAESQCYTDGNYMLYLADECLGITILTDTTERSPTFSLLPFENCNDSVRHLSLCYLCLANARDGAEAWRLVLRRQPRTIEWEGLGGAASMQRLAGFDFSAGAIGRREGDAGGAQHLQFSIAREKGGIRLSLGQNIAHVTVGDRGVLFEHLILKMLLNAHSTLVMGRLGRYERNIMTWVRTSNNKLIDRAIRYVGILLRERRIQRSYEDIALVLFEIMESLPADQSIVLATVNKMSA